MTQNQELDDIDAILSNTFNRENQNISIIYTTEIENDNQELLSEDDIQLKTLLRSFELEELYTDLKNARISFKNLKYLKRDDIKEVIKPVGLRAEFRQKLFLYLKSENAIDDENLSNDSKVITWLSRDETTDSPSSSKAPSFLSSQIPEYYYIPRQHKKNPSGKLYTKYFNLKTKRRKWDISVQSSSSVDGPDTREAIAVQEPEKSEESEIDESMSLSLKNILKRDCNDWKETVDKWERTFSLRQTDAKKYSKPEFLMEWPLYNDARAPSLIDIDFKLMYPGREHLLKSKWDDFKKHILKYYQNNIKNPNSKSLLVQGNETNKIDCEDYVFAVLLNSILLPSARFKSLDGSSKRKATIQDANESFVLIIPTISNYKIKIDELTTKYYQSKLTIQPFIVAEGTDGENLKAFYVFFDKTLYKLDSFIEGLDLCFKIFQVFNLEYPKNCELPWNFIQQFFYEINTPYDLKTPSLTLLLNYMKQSN
ncbi:uncharacterized protein LOC129919065 [Episyrphus balteatus]|uniref:uncharacterized protein LOC129919065 n=1 Tax=Episyrphus balteatus TaxID=286459 RepID=UPI002484EEA8|nr:uncharacterized protein LOC129919065 [Episyrphus balteatus]XP_055855863.1 uncharacterized protein LOC129919065 [Episyrphus balteatus]